MNKLKLPSTKQLIICGSLLFAAFLFLSGIAASDSFIMGLASDGMMHTVLRGITLLGLTVILFSKPPRPFAVRVVIGAMSSMILIGSFVAMADYHIGVIDAILYLLVAIVLAIESIEEKTAPVRFSKATQA